MFACFIFINITIIILLHLGLRTVSNTLFYTSIKLYQMLG